MGFKKGQPKPEGSGRQKGTPNRNSLRILDDLEDAGINLLSEFVQAARKIEDPEKRADKILCLFRHCYPTLRGDIDLPKTAGEPAAVPAAAPAALPPPGAPPPSALAGMNPKEILATFLQVAARSDSDG